MKEMKVHEGKPENAEMKAIQVEEIQGKDGPDGSEGDDGKQQNNRQETKDDLRQQEEQREYEARRKRRKAMLNRRRRKKRRKRIIITVLLFLIAAVCVIVYATGIWKLVPKAFGQLQTAISQKPEAGNTESAGIQSAGTEGAEAEVLELTDTVSIEEENAGEETEVVLTDSEKKAIHRARKYAEQYDYENAIQLLRDHPSYKHNEKLKGHVKKYKKIKKSCVSWPLEEVTHIFYHSLIVDTSRAFDGDYKQGDYDQTMTTMDEFNKITKTMYEKGYVMVSIYDMASVNEDGTMTPGEILLPPGKIPFILSQDDVCYYHYMDGDGFASKLVVDEDGKIRNEYVEKDGSVSVGDYDMVPLIDRFVEEHPDFSYRGAKGIIALTGYNGILGYRTDSSYETRPDDLDANKVEWLDAHPDFSLEEEREGARRTAEAMKKEGWLFASHTWGHQDIAKITLEHLQRDTGRFKENVDPLIGGTDIIIFAFGTDLTQSEDYHGDKYEFLKSQGYEYFCNVDSKEYSVQIRDNYFRQGRRNLDGYRMYYQPELLADLFSTQEVFDQARPVPVPEM